MGHGKGPVAKVVVYLLARWTFHPGDWRVDGSRPGYPHHCRVAAGNIASNADILPGGVLGKILMGVCRWDSETLNLYQTTFMSFLQPYSRLDAKNPYPIPD